MQIDDVLEILGIPAVPIYKSRFERERAFEDALIELTRQDFVVPAFIEQKLFSIYQQAEDASAN